MSDTLRVLLREAESLLRRGRSDEARGALSRARAELDAAPAAGGPLQAELERHRQLLARTVEVALARELAPVTERVLDALLETLGARRGFVGLVEGDGWRLLAARGLSHVDLDQPETQVSTGIIRQALFAKAPVRTGDALEELDTLGSVQALRLRSVLCLPLLGPEEAFGFVYLDNAELANQFDEAALQAATAWLPFAAACVARAAQTPSEAPSLPGVVTRSSALGAVLGELARVARVDATVLLSGETGTGKSLIARKLHAASRRSAGPFMQVNCGAIPEALVESELFGHMRGSFTGASADRAGRFEAAAGGTLFLDELDSLPLACQVKLLVALQERQITRVGSNTPVPIDVRVVAAVSGSPFDGISRGRLREDLYYRLAVFSVEIPPLRERPEDIPLLARHFLEEAQRRYELPPLRLSDAAVESLVSYAWPGNVRELANAVDRAALLAQGGLIETITPHSRRGTSAAPPPSPAPTPAPVPAQGVLELLRAAARAWVHRAETAPALRSLESAEVFPGFVLEALLGRVGDLEAAFTWLGQARAVESRNHHRVSRRLLERVRALEQTLGGGPGA